MNNLEEKIKQCELTLIRNRVILKFVTRRMTDLRNYSATKIIEKEGELIKEIIFLDEYDYKQLTGNKFCSYNLSFEYKFGKKTFKENRMYQLGDYIGFVTTGTSSCKFFEEFTRLFSNPQSSNIGFAFEGMSKKQKLVMFALLRISNLLNANHSWKTKDLRTLNLIKISRSRMSID